MVWFKSHLTPHADWANPYDNPRKRRRSMRIGAFLLLTTLVRADTLQELVDQERAVTIIPCDTYELEKPLRIPPNRQLMFEPGTYVKAKQDCFKGLRDSLIVIENVHNVTIYGDGVSFQMRQEDYKCVNEEVNPKGYVKSEWRHILDIRGSTNINIYGGTYEESGGDGIYIGPYQGSSRLPCVRVRIQNVTCRRNWRQGISVLAVDGLRIENTTLSKTWGTSPQAGIDFEPEWFNGPGGSWLSDTITDTVLTNVIAIGNRGPGFIVSMTKISPDARPLYIAFHNCHAYNVPNDQIPYLPLGVYGLDTTKGFLAENIPIGSYIGWFDSEVEAWKR